MVLHTGRPCPLRQIHLIRMHFAHVCLGDIDLVNCRDLRQAEVCRRFVRRTKDESVQGAWTATLQWSMGVSRKLSQLQDFGGMMQWCNISTWDFCALGHQGFGCRDQYWSQPWIAFFLPCFHAFARKKLVFFLSEAQARWHCCVVSLVLHWRQWLTVTAPPWIRLLCKSRGSSVGRWPAASSLEPSKRGLKWSECQWKYCKPCII